MFDDPLDKARMARVSRGDPAAFEELYGDYAAAVGAFFYRMCNDRDLAEDCLQDVFLKLWRAAGQYRGSAKFSTYLFQIAKYHWLNVRDRTRRPEPVGDIGETTGQGARQGSAAPDPHAEVEAGELRQVVGRAIAELSEEQRMCYVLAEVREMKYREIAEILEIPLGTVKSRMGAAERELRTRLRKYLGEE